MKQTIYENVAQRLAALRAKDSTREWRSAIVDPNEVKFTESPNLAAGMAEAMADLASGRDPGPLILREDEDGLWLVSSVHEVSAANSAGVLLALRATNKKEWPALIYREKISKAVPAVIIEEEQEDDEDEEDAEEWALTPDQKSKVLDDLKHAAEAAIAVMLLASEDDLYELALEGANWGGAATTQQIAAAAKDALDQSKKYSEGFFGDAVESAQEIVNDIYLSEEEFKAACGGYLEWLVNRSEKYAHGGGIYAWDHGTRAGSDTEGCVWSCRFGPGSCVDCISLHGQWMTWDEYFSIKWNTLCDGGCQCGNVPCNDPSEVEADDLESAEGEE